MLAYIVQLDAPAILSVYPFLLVFPLVMAAVVWITGLSVAWVTNQQETLARTTTLQFELDGEAKDRFTTIQNALANLARSVCIWRMVSQTPNWDWKRNAGASPILIRKRTAIRYMQPPFIQTPIKVYGVQFDSMQLFFLPDQLLIFQGGKYGAVNYGALQVFASPTRFIEDEGVPSDSTVVSRTWQYVRKDGGPDMRFRNNRQIPIALYGHIEIASQSGINLHLHVSNLSYVNSSLKHSMIMSASAKSRITLHQVRQHRVISNHRAINKKNNQNQKRPKIGRTKVLTPY